MLTFTHFHGCLAENVDDIKYDGRIAFQFQKLLHGHHSEGVAGENGGVAVPFLVNGGLSAPHVSFVHDVVMDEREVVQHLESGGDVARLFWVAVEHVRGDAHQLRTQTLPWLHQYVRDWIIKVCRFLALKNFLKMLFDGIHDFAGFKNLQKYKFLEN